MFKYEIREITPKQAIDIISTREPKGLFFIEGIKKYVGIDNQTGDAWVEEFPTAGGAIAWAIGYEEEER